MINSIDHIIKELKQFKRICINAGSSQVVEFELAPTELAFYNRNLELTNEAGKFHLWVSGSSSSELMAEFELTHD